MSRFIPDDVALARAQRGEAPALRPVSARPPLHRYLGQLWQRRHFISMQGWAQAMGQHQGTLLGNLWLIVAPVLDGLVYFFIFGVLFAGGRGIPNFFGYLIIGMFMFTFTSRVVSNCVRCVDDGRGLIRAFAFPRAALPVAVVWRELIGLLPVLYALAILLFVVPPYGTLGWAWLYFLPLLGLQTALNLGFGLIAARLGARLPDLRHLVPYLMRLLLYTSAVMFAVERFDAHPPLNVIARNNPIFLVLDACRSILLYNRVPAPELWWQLSAWAFGSLVIGMIFFWQAEVKYARNALE
ncbi:MAG: ABC transporter permease [Propionibacteriaceae bacterium]|nr:ABC transporter permease [Propionibacteriaceae bacterium]